MNTSTTADAPATAAAVARTLELVVACLANQYDKTTVFAGRNAVKSISAAELESVTFGMKITLKSEGLIPGRTAWSSIRKELDA